MLHSFALPVPAQCLCATPHVSWQSMPLSAPPLNLRQASCASRSWPPPNEVGCPAFGLICQPTCHFPRPSLLLHGPNPPLLLVTATAQATHSRTCALHLHRWTSLGLGQRRRCRRLHSWGAPFGAPRPRAAGLHPLHRQRPVWAARVQVQQHHPVSGSSSLSQSCQVMVVTRLCSPTACLPRRLPHPSLLSLATHRRVVLQECILRGTPQQLADNCTQDSRCVAWIWKDLFWRESPGAGALRGKEGADISRMLRTPATTIYFKQAAIGAAGTSAPSSSSDGDDGLAGGAIAGIVIGCAAAAVAAALGGWALLRRRQQQQGSSVRTVAPVASAVSGKTVKEGGDLLALPMPPSTDSWQDRQLSGQRSVLGSPQASSVTASPAAAAASVGASSHSEAGGAAPAGPPRPGRLPSSGSGSVILGRAVIGRPVAPSPFAAARQLRLTGPGSAVSHSSSAAGGGSVHASVDRSFSSPPMSMGLSSMGFPSPPARSEWASSAAQSGCAERTPSASAGAGAERKPEVQVELPQVSSASQAPGVGASA